VKILVTGASGFLGAAVVERLLAHGYTDVRCNVRQRSGTVKLEALRRRYPEATLQYCVGNLKYPEHAARAADGAQTLFHLAAGLKGAAADLFSDSVVASRNLLDAVGENRTIRIVLVSSLSVYGVAGLGRGAQVSEDTPLEANPERRDYYSYSKLCQEELFREYQRKRGFELVVLRPGVIYGPGGGHFSDRVGLMVGSRLLYLGGDNVLPLTYLDNCAEAVVVAGTARHTAGETFNVYDDDLPTCRQYLRAYQQQVRKVRAIPVSYFGLRLLSWILERYHRYSKGQLPSVLTQYKVASSWAGNRFDNSKLRSIGWRPLVSTPEGLLRAFTAFRAELRSA